MTLALHRLDADRAADFETVLRRAGGEAGRCLCTAGYIGCAESPEPARELRARMFREGRSDGFLLYRDGAPVGWCQATRRDALAFLCRGLALPPDPDAWAVTCLVLVPEARGAGLAHRLLQLVLERLRADGARTVQAIACRYAPDEDTSDGVEFPESLCRRAGLTLVRDHPMRPVYA